MHYELAKQLKDAGFSQELVLGTGLYYDDGKQLDIVCQGSGPECDCSTPGNEGYGIGEWVRCPTLSELIAACGDKFGSLWRAESDIEVVFGAKAEWNYQNDEATTRGVFGKTPEEAVANLWLALNPNDNDQP